MQTDCLCLFYFQLGKQAMLLMPTPYSVRLTFRVYAGVLAYAAGACYLARDTKPTCCAHNGIATECRQPSVYKT